MVTTPSFIRIRINETKHRLQLTSTFTLSSTVSELRRILSTRHFLSPNAYFLDSDGCRLHTTDEGQISISELLTENNIIQVKTNENEPSMTYRLDHHYENINAASTNLEDKQRITRKEMRTALQEPSSHMIEEIFTKLSQDTHIIVCGSPRVGKSTLINALCGRIVSKTNAGLAAVTQDITCYSVGGELDTGSEIVSYKYNFWDTPGFESWEKNNIQSKIKEIIEKPETKPLCMIFCASPGTFVDLERLESLLDLCILEKRIFVVLVCTNKYAGQVKSRRAVLEDFNGLLSKYSKYSPKIENDITFYSNIGLCAAVNSEPYEDDDRILAVSGINELIYGITTSLVDEQVLKWCFVVLENKGFWNDCQQKLGGLTDSLDDKFNAIKKLFQRNQMQTNQNKSSTTWYDN